MARRAGVDPVPLAAVPLLLACLASSVLPVSNLTTLIAVPALPALISAIAVLVTERAFAR